MNNICIKLFSHFHLYTLAQITFLKAISTHTLIVILKPSINHKIISFQRPFQRLCVTQKLFTKTIAKPTYLKSSPKLKIYSPAVKLKYPTIIAHKIVANAFKIENFILEYFVSPIASGTKVLTP